MSTAAVPIEPDKMPNVRYALLNDEPIQDGQGDLLNAAEMAEGIASMLVASRASSPFVLAIDAGWGMGKSTLLRQIESRLQDSSDILTLRYNAWTAEGENALEGLIKSVLSELDPNTVRRWVRRVAHKQHLMLITRVGISIAARFFGVTRLVDELWSRLGGDSKSRNEMRGLIHDMLSDWINHDEGRMVARSLVVFIDDLDRCSDDVVIKVCEAVKLYLDAPGLIFVIACDQSVLARRVSSSARGGSREGRVYLEKIVQVVYRVPLPEEAQIKNLIHGYARKSGIDNLIDENVVGVLAEGSRRNPRNVKRIINSFVLEYALDPSWQMPLLGSAQLVRAVLLQQLYASFYELLLRDEDGKDVIGRFLKYVKVRERLAEPPIDNPDDSWWDDVRQIFQEYQMTLHYPEDNVEKEFERLENQLPEDFRIYARDSAFIALLHGIGNEESRKAFSDQLIRRPLVTARMTPEVPLVDQSPIQGSVLDENIIRGSFDPIRTSSITSWSLSEALNRAYLEGVEFGEAVGRDAPSIWLEAVLARKPRMPSDLEARMLQSSILPADYLLQDEVRHVLRRGFWEALQRSSDAR